MANSMHMEWTAGEPRHAVTASYSRYPDGLDGEPALRLIRLVQELAQVRIGRIDEVNERVRLFRLELQAGPVEVPPPAPSIFIDAGSRPSLDLDASPKLTWVHVLSSLPANGWTHTCRASPSRAASPSRRRPRPRPTLDSTSLSPGNAVAAWLWQPAPRILGCELRVRVGGSFVFPPPRSLAAGLRRVVFVVGGVGVNTLVSMLRFVADARLDLEVCIAYATKVPRSGRLRDVLFLDTIAELLGRGRLRGTLSLHLTRAHGGEATVPAENFVHTLCGVRVDVSAARLSGDELCRLVKDGDTESTFVYICGPPAMTDQLVAALTAAGHVSMTRVMTEKWW